MDLLIGEITEMGLRFALAGVSPQIFFSHTDNTDSTDVLFQMNNHCHGDCFAHEHRFYFV